jgi:hypothetical protein
MFVCMYVGKKHHTLAYQLAVLHMDSAVRVSPFYTELRHLLCSVLKCSLPHYIFNATGGMVNLKTQSRSSSYL